MEIFHDQILGTSPRQESGEPPLTSLQHLNPNFSSILWIKYNVVCLPLDAIEGIKVSKLRKRTCSGKYMGRGMVSPQAVRLAHHTDRGQPLASSRLPGPTSVCCFPQQVTPLPSPWPWGLLATPAATFFCSLPGELDGEPARDNGKAQAQFLTTATTSGPRAL